MPRHKATARPKVKTAVKQALPKPKPPSVAKKAAIAAEKDRLLSAITLRNQQLAASNWLAKDLEIESGDYLDAYDFAKVIKETLDNPKVLEIANVLNRALARYDVDAGWTPKKCLTAEELSGLTERQKELAELLFVELLGLRSNVHRLNGSIQHIDETVSDVREIIAKFDEEGEKKSVMGPML